MTTFEYRLSVGVGVPLLLAAFGSLAKKLARGHGDWKRSDFYLGVEFSLAGVSTAMVSIAALLLNPAKPFMDSETNILIGNILAMVLGLFIFMYVISLHQQYENVPPRVTELKMLAGLANMLGGFVLLGSVTMLVT
jgi:hypothetical protein